MLNIITAEFIKGAVKSSQFPQTGLPEYAFFGRSNAGKSSLINMLLNRKNLVKTGSRPGMTREINFFAVNRPIKNGGAAGSVKNKGRAFCIADLPGYGFAQVSDPVRDRIDRMLYDYCTSRAELKTLFFLMDIRRDPTEVEQRTVEFFRSQGVDTALVATKADKIGKNEQVQRINLLASFFECSKESILLTSASKKIGREPLLQRMVSGMSIGGLKTE